MRNEDHVKALKNYIKQLKKGKITKSVIASIVRAKALIAYYEGISLDMVAKCYSFHEKHYVDLLKSLNLMDVMNLVMLHVPGGL